MSLHLSKNAIIKKTAQISILTLLSRVLGIIREFLLVRYLGLGAMSDAFIAAFRVPNFFRHVFAEGALSASFVPVMVKTVKEDNREEANGLMSIAFLFFEGVVLLMYGFVLWKTEWVIGLLAPGFSAEQIGYAIPFLRILFSFLLIASSSALLAGALHSVNHFFTPAFGTPLWNMFFVLTLLLCLHYQLSPLWLCVGIIVGGIAQLCAHLFMYLRLGFSFGRITIGSRAAFKSVLSKFLPCLFGVSIVELNLFVSGSIASFLPKGSISLLYLGSRFMNIPLGMFAVALANTLLPHFSRLVLYAPRRLNFYLLEVAKLVTWVIMPAMFFLMIIAKPLFILLLGDKATPDVVVLGGQVLVLYTSGLLFLCFNKILLSMLYSLKDTKAATLASGASAGTNILCDILAVLFIGTTGIAMANTIAGIVMSIMCLIFLQQRHNVTFYVRPYLSFLMRYLVQFGIACGIFLTGYYLLSSLGLRNDLFSAHTPSILYWICVGCLGGIMLLFLLTTRRLFKVEVYFLKK